MLPTWTKKQQCLQSFTSFIFKFCFKSLSTSMIVKPFLHACKCNCGRAVGLFFIYLFGEELKVFFLVIINVLIFVKFWSNSFMGWLWSCLACSLIDPWSDFSFILGQVLHFWKFSDAAWDILYCLTETAACNKEIKMKMLSLVCELDGS